MQVVTAPKNPVSLPGPPVNWSIHTQGLIELLRIRGPQQLHNGHDRNLFWLFASSVQMRALIAGIESPPFIEEWLMTFRPECPPEDMETLELHSFAGQSSSLSAKVQQALVARSLANLPWTLQQLWNEVQKLELLITRLVQGLPELHAVPIAKAHRLNHYRTCHTRLMYSVYILLDSNLPAQDPTSNATTIEDLKAEVVSSVQSLASATIESASNILGSPTSAQALSSSTPNCDWFNVLRTLWPLRMLNARQDLLTDEQVVSIKFMLNRINDDFCIRQAVAEQQIPGSVDLRQV